VEGQEGNPRPQEQENGQAKRHGKEPLVIIDKPDYSSLHGTPLQRTLYGFTRRLENLLSWYGVYWEEMRLYGTDVSHAL
jgi:hypothetical protein